MKYIIYKVTNIVNNKSYIGLTTQTLERRLYLHSWKASKCPTSHFHKALAKYEKDVWLTTLLEDGEAPDKEHIKNRERHFIAEHGTYIHGYNSTEGGEDFSSSEYQRQLQLDRVKNGSHPFLGGSIQSASMKRRHAKGEFKHQNHNRVQAGNHNFLGDSNPQKRLSELGLHHNQRGAWRNSKTLSNSEAVRAWKMADILYDWFVANGNRKRGGSYKALAKHFGLEVNLQKMYYEYFQKGWNPRSDIDWIEFAKD